MTLKRKRDRPLRRNLNVRGASIYPPIYIHRNVVGPRKQRAKEERSVLVGRCLFIFIPRVEFHPRLRDVLGGFSLEHATPCLRRRLAPAISSHNKKNRKQYCARILADQGQPRACPATHEV